MPTGPRPPARPGAGPGRSKPRPRPAPRPAAGSSPVGPSQVGDPDGPLGRAAGRTRRAGLRSSLTTRAIAFVVVLLVLVISYASSLRIYFAQAHEISATKAEIAERQRSIDDLQVELGRWGDPDYVRTQTRQQLGWVMPGETGYQVVGADGEPLGGGAAIEAESGTTDVPQDVWWAKLWGSVETADKPAPAKKKKDAPITTDTEPARGTR